MYSGIVWTLPPLVGGQIIRGDCPRWVTKVIVTDLDRHHTDFVAEVTKKLINNLSFAVFVQFHGSWELTAGKTYDFTGLSGLLDLRNYVRYR